MPTSSAFLARQLTETFTGPTWHGSSLAELLHDVNLSEARAHPLADGHSIAELVVHLTAWCEIAGRRLAGYAGDATAAEDWPVVEVSTEEQWRAAVKTLGARYAEIGRKAGALSESALHATLAGRTHTATDMLHGLVAHGAYHGGQMALLKKRVRGA
ncbi:MAG: DinB family protein [Gemmatimonadota bacterium]|nr:DinB family protein [Gemmatimonadota bacterium]